MSAMRGGFKHGKRENKGKKGRGGESRAHQHKPGPRKKAEVTATVAAGEGQNGGGASPPRRAAARRKVLRDRFLQQAVGLRYQSRRHASTGAAPVAAARVQG